MNSTLGASVSASSPSLLRLKTPSLNPLSVTRFVNSKPRSNSSVSALLTSRASSDGADKKHPIIQNLKSLTKTAILIGAAATMAGKFSVLPARAESPGTLTEEQIPVVDEERDEKVEIREGDVVESSPLSEFLEGNTEALEALKSLLQQKIENHEDEEALKILKRLASAQPAVFEWKFLMARLLNEIGQTGDARKVFEEILAANPLSFEALFENALLMDRCGEGEAVMSRLQGALDIAKEDNKEKEARDVRLIMAQMQFLQKNVDGALKSYQELAKEDPTDFRPYFCQGMIYSLLDRNVEAREQFAKYRELSPRNFEVEGYLRTPLSKMKVFGTNEEN
ncbi:protein SLOW GREEN 1 chloroplastic [Tripterygium wilfordii]|uniref:Protein SLOW GREEN 1 chloroplastic n=1 Tax=Tripterygium wilfordii TaxID=458696 RepID=A0A7J7DUJ8_TRIWF|nr:protein SLOW GREEN 1, chloroplastic [Tripterygium wilfordii]KAF5750040.1 protein SLOW GREEN 1 chloroplastic [Tripterygium wilfordii]